MLSRICIPHEFQVVVMARSMFRTKCSSVFQHLCDLLAPLPSLSQTLQCFLSSHPGLSQQCLLNLYFNHSLYKLCQTLVFCVFTWGIKRQGCLCKQESVGASEHPQCCTHGILPWLPSKLLMETSKMPSAVGVRLVQNSAVYLSLRNTQVFCETM